MQIYFLTPTTPPELGKPAGWGRRWEPTAYSIQPNEVDWAAICRGDFYWFGQKVGLGQIILESYEYVTQCTDIPKPKYVLAAKSFHPSWHSISWYAYRRHSLEYVLSTKGLVGYNICGLS